MNRLAHVLAEITNLPEDVMLVLLGVWTALTIGSVIRLVATRHSRSETRLSRFASLRTWWILLGIVTLAASFHRYGVACFLAACSVLGLQEYFHLVMANSQRSTRLFAYLAATSHFAWLATLPEAKIVWMIPLVAMAIFAGWHAARGLTSGFTIWMGKFAWGLFVLVILPSHVMLFFREANSESTHAGDGWFVYLILLTETNDIAQALWGRRFGKHLLTPIVSPHKTWEGLLGGTLTTAAVGFVVARYLTPLGQVTSPPGWFDMNLPIELKSVLAAVVISMSGFFGDISMSAIKRDFGVKDSGHLLPGQGGMLDRIDSLTFTAPALYYLIQVI